MGFMDSTRALILREILQGTGWVDRTRDFGRALRGVSTRAGGVLLVGTPQEEPWHLAAHLDDESRLTGIEELSPTLVRWQIPDGAPPHLSVSMQRLEQAQRGEAVFVVAPDEAPESLLERVADARRIGATILALDGGDTELEGLAHEALTIPADSTMTDEQLQRAVAAGEALVAPGMSFDTAQHLVSLATGEAALTPASTKRGLRDRLARLIDTVSGPASIE